MQGKRPFANANMAMFSANPVVPRSHNGITAGGIGGAAPHSPTLGVRRDFGLTPLFNPQLTVVGGLKQPPRG